MGIKASGRTCATGLIAVCPRALRRLPETWDESRHLRLSSNLIKCVDKPVVDEGVFVFVLDLGTALLDADVHFAFHGGPKTETELLAIPSERQVPRGLVTAIEVLVEPIVGRYNHRANSPINTFHAIIGSSILWPKQ